MKQTIELKYGKDTIAFEILQTAENLSITEPDPRSEDRLNQELRTDLLSALTGHVTGDSKVAVILADKTRLCQYERFLPVLIDTLEQADIDKSNITFFIAYGTHARQSDTECVTAYGDIYNQYRFVHHDCREKKRFKQIGVTQRKTPVHVRKDLLASDLVITFGALSHHYFAGYGGGRKLLFPGLGFRTDIYHNHSLFLDKTGHRLQPHCRPGNVTKNPLADDLKEIDSLIDLPRINIHGILDSSGTVCQFMVGHSYEDFLTGCRVLDQYYKAPVQKQYNTVLASCGGYPKDINFIQAHKAVHNAAGFVKEGGNLIVLAQCADGIGSETFLPYFQMNGRHAAFETLEKDYRGNGGTALSMMEKTERINIFIKTGLDDRICSTIGMKKIDCRRAQTLIDKETKDLATIQNASLLIC